MSTIVQSLGYAQYNYASENYASGIVDSADGIQFVSMVTPPENVNGIQVTANVTVENAIGIQVQSVATNLRTTGVQFSALNQTLKNVGFQFRGAIDTGILARGVQFRASKNWPHYHCSSGYAVAPYATLPYLVDSICATGGFQFDSRNTASQVNGLQFSATIQSQKNLGLQFRGQITQTKANGFQFTAIKSVNQGFQFRVVIYNTTNLRILSSFPSRGLTGTNWTASSTATSSTNAFSVNNVNTDIVEQVWRSVNAPGSAILTCDTEVAQGVFVDTLAILNHNFTGNTLVRLERSTNGINWATESDLLVEKENIYYIAPSLPRNAFRYWRLVINDATASVFQVGTIVFGSSVIFQGECFVDTVRYGKRQFSDKVFTEGFTNVSNDRGRKRFLGLEFRNLIFGNNNFQQLRGVFDTTGTLLKALYIPIPEAPSRFALFGKLNEIPEETHNYKGRDADYVDINLNVDESL